MPRPESVTAADVRRWDVELKFLAARGEFVATILDCHEYFREIWYCASWLGERLIELGVDKKLGNDVCAAAGQRMAFQDDPWLIVVAVVERFKQGIVDKPGPVLAEQLFRETFVEDANGQYQVRQREV
jgi:hypothetical protein